MIKFVSSVNKSQWRKFQIAINYVLCQCFLYPDNKELLLVLIDCPCWVWEEERATMDWQKLLSYSSGNEVIKTDLSSSGRLIE